MPHPRLKGSRSVRLTAPREHWAVERCQYDEGRTSQGSGRRPEPQQYAAARLRQSTMSWVRGVTYVSGPDMSLYGGGEELGSNLLHAGRRDGWYRAERLESPCQGGSPNGSMPARD